MHDHGSPQGSTTAYLVQVGRQQGGEILVEIPGPASPAARRDAEGIARDRLGAGEAVAWAAVGEPYVLAAEPVDADAVA